MDPLTLASIYSESLRLLNNVAIEVANVDAIWSKLFRVRKYLNEQAAAELGATLA
jgi:hypothetical protein